MFSASPRLIPILATTLVLITLPVSATTVTNSDDSGGGSLRDAISSTPSGGTIDFDSAVDGQTLTLTSGQLFIDKDLTIDASSLPAGFTVDAAGNSRVIEIGTGGHTVLFKSLTVTGGDEYYGGGLIIGSATVTITNCTFFGNTGVFGGALFKQGGTLTIENSTLSGNVATGGIGGGFINELGPASLIHCTIANNSAGFNNGGGGIGIGHGTFVTINNSIIAGNTGNGAPHDVQNFGSITTIGSNLIGTNHTMESEFPFDGVLVGNVGSPVNPLLAPLADYGGPAQTMLPLIGSPAIDSAAPSALTTDQRGIPRVNGPLPDIGAVESNSIFSGPPLADSDNDFIPDILEGAGGPFPQLTVGTDDSAVDTDGDGSTDAEEIANMTDPFHVRDHLRIISVERAPEYTATNPVYEITWSTFPGMSYSLECQSGLDFDSGIVLGPFTATGSTRTESVLLGSGGTDYVRVRRN